MVARIAVSKTILVVVLTKIMMKILLESLISFRKSAGPASQPAPSRAERAHSAISWPEGRHGPAPESVSLSKTLHQKTEPKRFHHPQKKSSRPLYSRLRSRFLALGVEIFQACLVAFVFTWLSSGCLLGLQLAGFLAKTLMRYQRN